MRCQLTCMPVRFGLILKHDNGFSNPLQVAHMALKKRILGIKSTSASWCVLQARNPCNFTGSGQLSNLGTGWLIQTAILYAMLWKQIFPLGILVLLIVGLDRWRMLLVICRMALYTEVIFNITGSRKVNISNLRIDLRFRHQAVWKEAHGQDPCSCLKKSVAYHNWFAFTWETGFWCTCTICLAGVFEDGSEQKCHEERSSVQDLKTWVEVWNWFVWQESGQECTCCNLCENGDYIQDEKHVIFSCIGTELSRHQFIHLFDSISEGDIKGSVFQHNSEVYKFISAAVDLFDWFICWDL